MIIIWLRKHFEDFSFKTRKNSFLNFDIIFLFMTAVFSRRWWWLLMSGFELFELSQIDLNVIIVIVNNFIFWLIDDALKAVRFGIFIVETINCLNNQKWWLNVKFIWSNWKLMFVMVYKKQKNYLHKKILKIKKIFIVKWKLFKLIKIKI